MMDPLIEFLRMDGFAVWVWSSVGLTAVVMAVMAVAIHRRHRRALQSIRRLHTGVRS